MASSEAGVSRGLAAGDATVASAAAEGMGQGIYAVGEGRTEGHQFRPTRRDPSSWRSKQAPSTGSACRQGEAIAKMRREADEAWAEHLRSRPIDVRLSKARGRLH